MGKGKKRHSQLEAESRNRIPANQAEQVPNNSYDPPRYYEDLPFKCQECGADEVWTAEQQQWWYEVAKGPIYSRAVRCRACREKHRNTQYPTPPRSHAERQRDAEQ